MNMDRRSAIKKSIKQKIILQQVLPGKAMFSATVFIFSLHDCLTLDVNHTSERSNSVDRAGNMADSSKLQDKGKGKANHVSPKAERMYIKLEGVDGDCKLSQNDCSALAYVPITRLRQLLGGQSTTAVGLV